jgi:hypothetical protein
VGNNVVNFRDSFGFSAEDVEKIEKEMHEFVDELVASGKRKSGEGGVNGWVNNFLASTFKPNYYGCIDQTNILISRLKNLTLDDKWDFIHTRIAYTHSNIEAISDNENDSLLTVDPWKNTIEEH